MNANSYITTDELIYTINLLAMINPLNKRTGC